MSRNAVLPEEGPPSGNMRQLSGRQSRRRSVFNSVTAHWEQIQIFNRGKYSVEQMGALDDYFRRASHARVLAVIMLTPVPALALAVLIECIPLENPAEGWQANFGAWARMTVLCFSIAAGTLFQLRTTMPDIPLSTQTIFVITVLTACGSMLVMMACCSVTSFPFPFFFIINALPFHIFFVIFFLVAIRYQGESVHLATQHKRQLYLIILQPFLLTVYIGFNAAFAWSSSKVQVALILALFFIKLALKNLAAWTYSHDEEAIPGIVVFTVELVHAMYVSICMQTASSRWTTIAVIGLDSGHALLSLHQINAETREVQEFQRERSSSAWARQILAAVLQNRRKVSQSAIQAPRITMLHPQLSVANASFGLPATTSKDLIKISEELTAKPIEKYSGRSRISRISSIHSDYKVVNETRRMMFRSEYLVLVEYVECVIPVLYAVYLSVLLHLPSAKYYPHSRSLSPEELPRIVASLLLYSALEALALIGLHVLLKRKFGFSPLCQLAFTLETELQQLQGRLFVWIPCIMLLTLRHFGMDFTFHFDQLTS